MFCNCDFCRQARKAGARERRTRSQVIIDGDLSIDFPPDAYVHSLSAGVDLSNLENLLVTHSHMDHFYAHDFILRGYKYAALSGANLNIYGNSEVESVFAECTRREMRKEVAQGIIFNTVGAYESFMVGDYRVLTLPAVHGTKEEALLYYVEKRGKGYLHLCDTGALFDEAVDFLAKNGAHAHLITFDCTFLTDEVRAGARHMCLTDNMSIKARLDGAGVSDARTKSVITHFSHNARPWRDKLLEIEKNYPVTAAYDGLTLEI